MVDSMPLRIVVAVGLPAVLIGIWMVAVAPGAENPLGQQLRMLIGSGLLLLVAGGLWMAGQHLLGAILGGLVVLNTLVLLVLE
jgi:hypothetical protein